MGRDLWERAGDPEFEPRLGQKTRHTRRVLVVLLHRNQGHVAKWMNAPVSDTQTRRTTRALKNNARERERQRERVREREKSSLLLLLRATGSLFFFVLVRYIAFSFFRERITYHIFESLNPIRLKSTSLTT